ncbi:MAG TPA: sialidase family protein [Terriglobales bacterium]|nr:sialidase family protein [Terriglobales bacterium]
MKLSTDTFSNSTSQHATEVEPGSFSFGSTVITSFQVGRIQGGGGADIGFAVSTDGALTWTNGFLPGITTFQGNGTNSAVSDTNVAYDPKHGVWLISSLPISSTNVQVAVSRSTDGGSTWTNPIVVAQSPGLDKNWLVCDGSTTSPHYGNCYMEWDDNNNGNLIQMSTSSDGGLTWSAAVSPSGMPHGLGGQPLAQPGGTVLVPYLADAMVPAKILSFSSNDGGATWSSSVPVSTVSDHVVAGGLRSDALPSAQIDGAGNVYVIWQDCRFRTNCSSNDLVLSTSADGGTWTTPARIPIDSTTSTVDHFIPGLGIDPNTSGSGAHLALTYYYYPVATCTSATCALYVGIISSLDGGQTWSNPTPLAGPMSLSWLPSTFSGQMVADYISTSFVNGKAYGFFAVAAAKSGTTFDQAIYTNQSGMDVLTAQGRNNSAGVQPASSIRSSRATAPAPSRTWR